MFMKLHPVDVMTEKSVDQLAMKSIEESDEYFKFREIRHSGKVRRRKSDRFIFVNKKGLNDGKAKDR